MNVDYSQFFNMMPEVTLTLVLVIVFIADLVAAKEAKRKWENNLVCALMTLHFLVNLSGSGDVTAFGGMYYSTQAIAAVKSILAFGTILVLLQSYHWLNGQNTRSRQGEFYLLVISTLLGMNFMVSANNFLLFFLGLEMASVPMACLVAYARFKQDSAEAAAKYILTATFSSGVMVYGLSMLYGAVGNLYFCNFAAAVTATPLTVAGLVFFFSGLAFKLSLVPFHFWTADTYQGAPAVVGGYLSVISKGAAAVALLTILTKVFGSMIDYWHPMMCIVIVLSITVANLFAIRQKNVKRFMAFSSISQAGYIMLATIGTDWTMSASALLYYVLIYIVANMSVFTIISVVEQNNNGKTRISDYDGLYQTNPKLAFLMTLALFSLGGIPPFAGMFSKFFVFLAAAKAGSAWAYAIVFIALVNTVVSLYYYLLIVKAMYINKTESPLPAFRSDCSTKLALLLCTVGVLLFGVCSCIFDWINASV